MPRTVTIAELQGPDFISPFSGERVTTRGVVTGRTRKGFFIQDPSPGDGKRSCGIFVFARRGQPPVDSLVEVEGEAVDFRAEEEDRPTTQLAARGIEVKSKDGPRIEPVWLTAKWLDRPMAELSLDLNALEGMLVGIEPGATFTAPSNPFGDYVVLPEGARGSRSIEGGVLVDPEEPQRWVPSFRILDYDRAPMVNVGAKLRTPVVGPLNYRAQAYQIAARDTIEVEAARIDTSITSLESSADALTILTLNGFNLDPHVEKPLRVKDPRRDVDDDVGDGRYRMLAEAIVEAAKQPDLVALQEIQDDDGAEITAVVRATRNLSLLTQTIQRVGGPRYRWAEIPPTAGGDGGQPGGNIRNAFLYDPERIELVEGSMRRLGEEEDAFESSRKPLVARFRHRASGRELAVINVHLASKRHQHSIFTPERPGWDPKLELRVSQARLVASEVKAQIEAHSSRKLEVYVTGDFNDTEFSETMAVFTESGYVNLVDHLDPNQRFDYNHRGVLQALMHAVVTREQFDGRRTEYEILHGNELIGSRPGHTGERATDHAYVIARLSMRD